MQLKIFKSTLLAAIIIVCSHGIAVSQDISSKEEKKTDLKMQEFELKMKDLQIKLDTLKLDEKIKLNLQNLKIASKNFNKKFKKQFKNFDKNLNFKFEGIDKTLNDAFKGLDESMNFNFTYLDSSSEDKNQNTQTKELTKNYSKTYAINSGDKLQIDNKYGKVIVNTWNKNEFKVDVEIKAAAYGDGDAQKILDGVSIIDNKNGSLVEFTTKINNEANGSWNIWSGIKNHAHKVEVNYMIYMPSKNALSITNRYGATVLPDFSGKVTINSSYGSFNAKNLTNEVNDITSRYGSAVVESLMGGTLKIAYGNLNLESCDNINADISYGSAKIGKIKTSGIVKIRYTGGFQITEVDKNLKKLDIDAAYSNVLLGINGNPDFDFDVTVNYGDFHAGDHSTINNKSPEDERGFNPTKTYRGHIGKGNADKMVIITSKYGNVKFN